MHKPQQFLLNLDEHPLLGEVSLPKEEPFPSPEEPIVNAKEVLKDLRSHSLATAKFAEERLFRFAAHPFRSASLNNPFAKTLHLESAAIEALQHQYGKRTYIELPSLPHHPHIGRHCLAVSFIAKSLGEILGLSEREIGKTTRLALLHDAAKLPQILALRRTELTADKRNSARQFRSAFCSVCQANGETEKISQALATINLHFSEQRVCKLLRWDSEKKSVTLRPLSWPKKLVHVADAMVAEDRLSHPRTRFFNEDFKARRPSLWKSGIVVKESRSRPQLAYSSDIHSTESSTRVLGNTIDCYTAIIFAHASDIAREIAPHDSTAFSDPFSLLKAAIVQRQKNSHLLHLTGDTT